MRRIMNGIEINTVVNLKILLASVIPEGLA